LTAVVFGGIFANPTGPPHLFCAADSKGLQNCDQRLKKSFSTESAESGLRRSFAARTQDQFDPQRQQHDFKRHGPQMPTSVGRKELGRVAGLKAGVFVEFKHGQAKGGPASIEGFRKVG
jgi:hypothetical protein